MGRNVVRMRNAWQRLVRTRRSFSAITRADVLLIDSEGAKEIARLIPANVSRATFYARGELLHVNVRTVLLALGYVLRGRTPWVAYVGAVIRQVNPRVALTFIDNTPYFHEMAKLFPGIPFVAVQNGNRFPYIDSTLPADQVYSSILFTFGDYEIESYRLQNTRFSEIKACGSLRSSLSWLKQNYDDSEQQVDFDICFVSSSFLIEDDYWYYENELLATWLSEYLTVHHSQVAVVAMRTGPDDQQAHEFEKAFYQRLFSHRVTLSPRLTSDATYKTMDNSHVTISCGSSASIESLGRGNRSLICHPLYRPSGPLDVSAPFILETSDRQEFFMKVDEFLSMTDKCFRAEYQQSIDFFCRPAGEGEILTALAGCLSVPHNDLADPSHS